MVCWRDYERVCERALVANSYSQQLGRSKLTVPGPGIPDFRAAIDSLFEYTSSNPAEPRESAETAGTSSSSSGGRRIPEPLHSERFISEGKKFYLDLLSNDRGQYVKVSQATTRRISMILPVAALRHLREAMAQIERLAPPDPAVLNPGPLGHTTRSVDRQVSLQDETTVVTKAVQRELRVEGKRIVFESGANRRGSYLRISDNTSTTKSHVIVPHSCVSAVIKLLEEVRDSEDPLNVLRAVLASGEAENQ